MNSFEIYFAEAAREAVKLKLYSHFFAIANSRGVRTNGTKFFHRDSSSIMYTEGMRLTSRKTTRRAAYT